MDDITDGFGDLLGPIKPKKEKKVTTKINLKNNPKEKLLQGTEQLEENEDDDPWNDLDGVGCLSAEWHR